MTEDWDVQQRTEYNFIRIYERKTSDKHSKEDGETLERFYNRINLDEKRRKILDDSKEKNDVYPEINRTI
jgi:hypothetical protein